MPHRLCDLHEHTYDDAIHAYCPHCPKQNKGTARAAAPPPIAETQIIGRPGTAAGTRLTVGWLVIVEGPGRGKDLRVLPGQNRIGRNPTMDIPLSEDPSVTGEDHARLMYDEQGRFYLWHGNGKNLTYINGGLIDKQELKPHDRIKIGQTVLLFVPLCGEKFQW